MCGILALVGRDFRKRAWEQKALAKSLYQFIISCLTFRLQQHNSGQRQNRIPTQDTSGQNSGTHESNADNQVEESDNNSGERYTSQK